MLTSTSSQARNISGYLSGLSSPSVTEQTMIRASSPTRNSAGQTRLPTFSITSRSMSAERQRGERRAHHVRVEMALAAEPGVGVELVDRDVQQRRAGRRRSVPCTSPSSTPARTPLARPASARSSSGVLPAPGALIRLTTVTAGAVEVLAVGARDRVVGVEHVLDDPAPWCGAWAPLLHRPDLHVALELRRTVRPRRRRAASSAIPASRLALVMPRPLRSRVVSSSSSTDSTSSHRLVERRPHRRAEPRRDLLLVAGACAVAARSRRPASRGGSAPSARASASTVTGSIPCASTARRAGLELGLDHVQRARRLAAARHARRRSTTAS